MKRLNIALFFFILISYNLYGQKNNILVYEIADYYHFKSGAISFTFDDGVPNQFTIGRENLDKFNFKGTFFIITGAKNNWDIFREMVKDGHEIGSHTISHPQLKKIELKEVRKEMQGSKLAIEDSIRGYKCQSFCYPFGSSNKSISHIAAQIYIGARTTFSDYNLPTTADFFSLSTCIFVSKTKLDIAKIWVDEVIHENKWLIETYHGFDSEGWEPFPSNLFFKHLQYVNSKKDKLWITTFGDGIKYFKERQCVKVELTDFSDDYYKIAVKDCLPDSIFDFPLTLKFRIPKEWGDIKVTQNGIQLDFQLQTDVCNNLSITFDAIPDKGEIYIKAEKILNREDVYCETCDLPIFPNPFDQTITLLSDPGIKGNISIYNFKGTCLFKGELNSEILGIDTSLWEKGYYIVTFKQKDSSIIKERKIIKQ